MTDLRFIFGVYYLDTSTTCERIQKEILNANSFTLHEFNGYPTTPAEIDAMKKLAGSCEALFSRIASKYCAWGVEGRKATEKKSGGTSTRGGSAPTRMLA